MKKNLIIVSVFILLFSLASCFPEAKCHLINENVDVVIDNSLLAYYEEGDTFFAIKSEVLYGQWEVTEKGEYKRDTSFIFQSKEGPYRKTVSKAVVIEKL